MRTAYIDIETTYVGAFTDNRLFKDFANHRITVVGIRVVEAGADEFLQIVGGEVTRERLLAALGGVGLIVSFNGRSKPDALKGYIGFDFPVVAAQLGVVLDEEFAHRDLCPECWKQGLYGGLKAVEQRLGLTRKLPGKDGQWADLTWRNYQKTKDKSLLDELLAYNREDVFMLRSLEEMLAKRAKR
ncbi:MAG: ribonuclease H-like domain-containing protein [Terriglobia bacterium]